MATNNNLYQLQMQVRMQSNACKARRSNNGKINNKYTIIATPTVVITLCFEYVL